MEKNSNSKNWSESRPLWLVSTSMAMHYTELVYDSVLTTERGRYSDSSKFVLCLNSNPQLDLRPFHFIPKQNQSKKNYQSESKKLSQRGPNEYSKQKQGNCPKSILKIRPGKIQARTRFKPMTSAISVQHSTN